jgi:dTDP-glucose 4,6-dehydratase
VHPQPEGYHGNVDPVGPRAVYDEAKRYAEALTTAYGATHGVPVRIARIFNTYGPRLRPDDGRAIPTFVRQALRGEPLTVHGDGTQTRSFCYVDDLVEGLWRLLGSDVTSPVNVGNPEELSVLHLALLIRTLSDSESEVVFDEGREDDPCVRRPDITRARRELGWEPDIPLIAGLQWTIAWARRTWPVPRKGSVALHAAGARSA